MSYNRRGRYWAPYGHKGDARSEGKPNQSNVFSHYLTSTVEIEFRFAAKWSECGCADTTETRSLSYCTLFSSEEAELGWAETRHRHKSTLIAFRLPVHMLEPSQVFYTKTSHTCLKKCVCVQTSTVESIGPPVCCVWRDGQKRQEIFDSEIKATRFHTLKSNREENKNNARHFSWCESKSDTLRFMTITSCSISIQSYLDTDQPLQSPLNARQSFRVSDGLKKKEVVRRQLQHLLCGTHSRDKRQTWPGR